MTGNEEWKEQGASYVSAVARREAIHDGFDPLVADYIASKVYDAYEAGWNSALVINKNV